MNQVKTRYWIHILVTLSLSMAFGALMHWIMPDQTTFQWFVYNLALQGVFARATLHAKKMGDLDEPK